MTPGARPALNPSGTSVPELLTSSIRNHVTRGKQQKERTKERKYESRTWILRRREQKNRQGVGVTRQGWAEDNTRSLTLARWRAVCRRPVGRPTNVLHCRDSRLVTQSVQKSRSCGFNDEIIILLPTLRVHHARVMMLVFLHGCLSMVLFGDRPMHPRGPVSVAVRSIRRIRGLMGVGRRTGVVVGTGSNHVALEGAKGVEWRSRHTIGIRARFVGACNGRGTRIRRLGLMKMVLLVSTVHRSPAIRA